LILVQVAKAGYPHMKKVADLIRQPGALAPLEALLNPGKSMPAQPDQPGIASSYTLSFLPKLHTLTPLTVPADAKLSTAPVIPFNNPPAAGNINIDLPAKSAKLGELPAQVLTAEAYKNYIQELASKIGAAISPEEKQKADAFLKNKKLSSSKDISNTALAAWLQKSPKASLYLYSKAVIANTSDALAANNFAAFLIMGGLPEKAVPVLAYWNRQRPTAPAVLSNLGNAFYRLGDMTTALNWLQQAVKQDSLHPIANKLLCVLYLKNGDVKKAKDHGTRSITKCHDEQVIAILRQLDNRVKPGEIMSRFPPLPAKQFPMLERIKLPKMPSGLDDMEQFEIELNAIKQSVTKTIADIENKAPKVGDDMQQKVLMASLQKGISSMRVKAQHIIMDGMQVYQTEKVKEADVFRHHLKKLNVLFNAAVKAIQTKYNNDMKGLEGGEGGDEDVIAAKELARCKALNGEKEIYLAGLSRLVNQYAARQEYISRKFFRDYANWAPYWLPETSVSFPSIERDYLKDVLNILGEYQVVKKSNCEIFEPLPIKEGALQKWEEEYCANFKGKIGVGPGKVTWNCNSWSIEAGEGIVGGLGVNYNEDGSFEDFYFELGVGVSWSMGEEHIAKAGAGATVKEFVKFGTDKATGEWEVKDAGFKGEIAIEQEIGNVGAELKVIEVTAGYRSGITKEGILVPILDLK
jgi:Flp pilus assembly protein TadD